MRQLGNSRHVTFSRTVSAIAAVGNAIITCHVLSYITFHAIINPLPCFRHYHPQEPGWLSRYRVGLKAGPPTEPSRLLWVGGWVDGWMAPSV
jgi:hypothetical protein